MITFHATIGTQLVKLGTVDTDECREHQPAVVIAALRTLADTIETRVAFAHLTGGLDR